jgi:gas vesicle protein
MADAEVPGGAPDREAAEAAWSGATFVAGVVVGALIGASIALLIAPARGAVVRRRLGWRARELGERARDGIREGLEDATHHARRDLLRKRRRLQAKLDRLSDDVRESLTDPI